MGGKKKKTTIGYKYYMGLFMGICRGPIDALSQIRVGGKVAWTGRVSANSPITIRQPRLFGGDEQEGGIDGTLDVMLGAKDQPRNNSLAAMLGGQVSAFRGVATTFFDGLVCAMSPYPKEWEYLVQKTKAGWHKDECWYPQKCELLMSANSIRFDTEWSYLFEPGSGSHGDYSATDYDHTAWTKGPGGFGSGLSLPDMAGLSIGTVLPAGVGNTVWIRRAVNLSSDALVDVWHDNGAWLWIDGVAAPLQRIGEYQSQAILPAGQHVVALKVVDSVPSGTPGIFASIEITSQDIDLLIYGMNPAHILHRLYTDPVIGRGLPAARLDDEAWRIAADQFYAEGFGLCLKWARTGSIAEFAGTVIDHAGAVLYTSRRTGKIVLKAIRDDYDVEDLPLFTPDTGLLGFDDDQASAQAGGINEVIVKYFDPMAKKEQAVREKNLGGILAAGGVTISREISYPGLPTEALARRVARRDLQAGSGIIKKFTVRLDRRGVDIMPGHAFRIADASRGIGNIVLRAGRVEYGTPTDGTITVTALQDVFGLPATVYRNPEENAYVPPDTSIRAATVQMAMEAPYRELVQTMSAADLTMLPEGAGYLHAAAVRPTTLSQSFALQTRVAPAAYTSAADMATFCPGGILAAALDYLDTTAVLQNAQALDALEPGTAALIGSEIVRVDAVDVATATLTVARGCADTVPARHDAGTPVLCYDTWGGDDQKEYTAGVSVDAVLLTSTGAGQLATEAAPVQTVVFSNRAARPYPPANVLINGERYPAEIAGDLTLAWAHRDRILQADNLIDAVQGSIGPEPGTRYAVELYDAGSNTLLHSIADIDDVSATVPASTLAYSNRLELYAVRNALESWQRVKHVFTVGEEPQTILPPITDENATFIDECDSTSGYTVQGGTLEVTGNGLRLTKTVSGQVGIASKTIDFTPANRDWIAYFKVRASRIGNAGSPDVSYIWFAAGTTYFQVVINQSSSTAYSPGSITLLYFAPTGNKSATTSGLPTDTGVELAMSYDSKHGQLNLFLRETANGAKFWKFLGAVACGWAEATTLEFAKYSTAPVGAWMEVDYVQLCQPNIIAIGDSHCAGATLFNPNRALGLLNPDSTWQRHAALYQHLRNNLIVNKGVGSQTSAMLLARIADATAQGAKVVFLHASSNDVVASIGKAERTANIQATVNAINASGAKCVLLNALYGTQTEAGNLPTPVHRDYMKDWWDTDRVELTGVYLSVDIMQPVITEDGFLNPSLAQADKVHLTVAGYAAVGAMLTALANEEEP